MDLEHAFEQARRQLEAGRNREAQRAFERVLEVLDDDHPLPTFDKARVAVLRCLAIARQGRPAEVLEDLDWIHGYFVDFMGEDYEDAMETLGARSEVRLLAGDRRGAVADARALQRILRETKDLSELQRDIATRLSRERLAALRLREHAP